QFRHSSLQEELTANPPGTYNKIHLSNIGDWMSDAAFEAFISILDLTCPVDGRLCYRFLQKNHLEHTHRLDHRFEIRPLPSAFKDRFPFYSTLSIHAYA
ncbi:MAG TPA: hypothetical protein VJ508_06650, partial [Saprospiraceae bacterium]|nr:hypothetical protein [Saprospiraceae bacterium]